MSLITIDQLLESVDLDFEPRWVTKDENGWISLWKEKPTKIKSCWIDSGQRTHIGCLKLAEFDGKDWTECIYEVPRKTTTNSKKELVGKIEKLANRVNGSLIIPPMNNEIVHKINELVDAVNKHADIIRQIGQWGSSKGEFLWCETLTKFEPKELKGAK